tara:strand:+ start:264 stop:857 length:594 start_codon:yes stop_codon:yes gene_type:complete
MIFIIIIIIYKVPLKMPKPSDECKLCKSLVFNVDHGLCYKHALKSYAKYVENNEQFEAKISHWRSLIVALIVPNSKLMERDLLLEIESIQKQLEDVALSNRHTIIQKPKRGQNNGNHYWYHTSNPFHRNTEDSYSNDKSNARALYREVLDASCDSPDVIYGFDELVKLDTILIIPEYIPRQTTKQNKKQKNKQTSFN